MEDVGPDLEEYPNVPRTIATVISSKMATLHELDTIYGIEDLYDMLEIIVINARNQREANKFYADKGRGI